MGAVVGIGTCSTRCVEVRKITRPVELNINMVRMRSEREVEYLISPLEYDVGLAQATASR